MGKSGDLRKKAVPLLEQVAALPYRVDDDGRRQVLLMTSRQTRRFVVPKGWPMKKRTKREAAAIEAFQEAGVTGKISRKPIGRFTYWKRLDETFALVRVSVYGLKVKRQSAIWPEKDERLFRWLAPEDAALLVDEPGLADIIRNLS